MVSSRQSGAPSRDRSRDEKKKASKTAIHREARNDRLRLFDRAAASVVVFRELCAKKKTAKKRDQKATEVFPRTRSDAPRAGVRRTRVGRARGCRDRQNDGSASCDERAAWNLASLWRASVSDLRGVCRGARASPPYLPGMPREMTAHLLPYTACAARIFLSSSSVNGPRFTEGLSWLHHLRGRNNEIRNNESRLVRTTKGREGTRGVGEGGGRGSGPETREPGDEGSPDARAASTRRFPRRRAPENAFGGARTLDDSSCCCDRLTPRRWRSSCPVLRDYRFAREATRPPAMGVGGGERGAREARISGSRSQSSARRRAGDPPPEAAAKAK